MGLLLHIKLRNSGVGRTPILEQGLSNMGFLQQSFSVLSTQESHEALRSDSTLCQRRDGNTQHLCAEMVGCSTRDSLNNVFGC